MKNRTSSPNGRRHTKENRDQLIKERDELIQYLKANGGEDTVAKASEALGVHVGRPGQIAGQFPMSVVSYRDSSKGKSYVALHPHLMMEVAV